MSRSDRYLEAVRALEDWKFAQRVRTPDLFTVRSTPIGDAWKAEALTAIERVARSRSELTVEDVAWSPAIDNRAAAQRCNSPRVGVGFARSGG